MTDRPATTPLVSGEDLALLRWALPPLGLRMVVYSIFRGRRGRPLGSAFGSAVWVLAAKTHGMPAIRTYSHVEFDRGTVIRYEFDAASRPGLSRTLTVPVAA